MNSDNTVDVLNRLVALHYRSLPSYLSYASPTWHRGDENAKKALSDIARDQQDTVDRLGELISERGGVIDFGAFPMVFTGYHDLSFEFLLGELLTRQERDIEVIVQCVAAVSHTPLVQSVVQEILGEAKGHLDTLRDLQREATAPA